MIRKTAITHRPIRFRFSRKHLLQIPIFVEPNTTISLTRISEAPPGLDSLRFLQVRFSVCKERSPAFSPSFLLWCGKQDRDSRGSTPLGQRRSQAPPGLDSSRLLQAPRFLGLQKKKPSIFAELFFVVRETRTARSRGSTPVLGQRRCFRPTRGLIHCGGSSVRFLGSQKKKPGVLAELFSSVRETGLDSRGSTPLGQRRSQAPPGLDSLRLLQVRFPSLQKKKPSAFAELSLWCGKQDWILAARRRSVSAVLKPHRGLIHCGFFKSVSPSLQKRSPALLPSFFLGAGNRT